MMSLLLLLILLATTLLNNCIEGAFVASSRKNGKSDNGVIEKNGIHQKLVERDNRIRSSNRRHHVTSNVFMSNDNDNDDLNNNFDNNSYTLDIVLMSVGDLRVDDHSGFQNAISNIKTVTNKILPIVVLTNDILANTPGVIAHTIDTTTILVDAINDINDSLMTTCTSMMKLHYLQGLTVQSSLQQMLVEQKDNYNKIRIHVCDLGDADNNMGYNVYSQLTKAIKHNRDSKWEIIPWTSNLRTQPWQDVLSKFTDKYPEYVSKYTKSIKPIEPVDLDNTSMKIIINDDNIINIKEYQNLPTYETLLQHIQGVLSLDSDRCQSEESTGMYGTHWGGLQSNTVKGSNVLQTVSSFVRDYKENDLQWMTSNYFQEKLQVSSYNPRSLEHASMKWQLQDSNWMAGESITRYLAAPLLYGTISLRRLWYIANENANPLLDDSSLFFPSSSIKQMVEGSEWHKLLATKYIRTDPSYGTAGSSSTSSTNNAIPPQQQTTYKYWRYQGFLCRYAITNFNNNENQSNEPNSRNGIILVHGFGASGSQWNKVMSEIGTCINDSNDDDGTIICQQGLAPDLIGFGHSEKPGVSYTGYMWDSQISDFCKEIAIVQQKLDTFIIGGNSIGGFTSLSAAASDTASIVGQDVSSNGSPGTLRCSGLVLMNSAGPIKTANEIQIEMETAKMQNAKSSSSVLSSIAVQTMNGQLKPCTPPPRPVARAFGNVLLGYLRPQIQSICKNLYPTNPDAVDTVLCEGILRDSLDPGAVYVMMAGAKLPTPRTANELLNAQFGNGSTSITTGTIPNTNSITESVFTGPVLIAQGVLDPLNDAMDRMNRFASLRDGITPDPIQAGHCPHDEQPNLVAKSIVSWMNIKQPFGIISSSKSKLVSSVLK